MLIVSIMELPIDRALPLALLPRVGGQVVEAKTVATILACSWSAAQLQQEGDVWKWDRMTIMNVMMKVKIDPMAMIINNNDIIFAIW